MDFYITKYQGKAMESLTPLFKCMTDGVHRLERQEQEEEAEAEKASKALADETGQEAPRKQPKTMEQIARRARRLTIRLASMANRCFWVSAAELTVHILTDGDCLQSHNNITVFTRQLQWAVQQCKKHLNGETVEHEPQQVFRHVQTVAVHVPDFDQTEQDQVDDDAQDADGAKVEIIKVEACTHSTNAADDYAHRGTKLQNMPFYIYRMYVRRIPNPSQAKVRSPTIFCFEPHYAMARSYAQEVILNNISVPTIDGFQCPTVEQDAEQNALLKAILFTPWSCTDPMMCGSVLNYQRHLSNNEHPDNTAGAAPQPAASSSRAADASQSAASSSSSRGPQQRTYTFQRAWNLRCSEINTLAYRADCRCLSARKKLVMADTTLFADVKEPKSEIEDGEEVRQLLVTFYTTRLRRSPPCHGVRTIMAFLGMPCRWHEEQCTLAEFSAYIARDVVAHIDLAAEARVKKPSKPLDDAESEDESDDDRINRRTIPAVELVDMGGGDNDNADADVEDVPIGELSRFPLSDVNTTISLCLQQADLASLDTKRLDKRSWKLSLTHIVCFS